MSTLVRVVNSPKELESFLSEDLNRVSLINFWAPWAEPCTTMNIVVGELSKKYPQALVLQVRYSKFGSYLHATYPWYLR